MKFKIIKDSNPIMKKKSLPVDLPLSQEDRDTLDWMLDYLKKSQDEEYAKKHNIRPGIGLAAIQIGLLKRMFVVYYGEGEDLVQYQLVNPKIIEYSLRKCALKDGEGCLSVNREVDGIVPRFARVTIEGYDEDGNKIRIRAREELAIAFQHELDHLEGILFTDKIDTKNPYKNKEKYREI